MFSFLLAQAITITPTMAQLVGERAGMFWCEQFERGVSNYDQLSLAVSRSPDPIIQRSPDLSGHWRVNKPELYRRYMQGLSDTIFTTCPANWERFMENNR